MEPGTPALKVDLLDSVTGLERTAASEGQIRFLRFHPFGVGIDSNTSTMCYSPPVAGGSCPGGGPTSRTVANPQAGVWEVTVEARRTSDDLDATSFRLRASVLGASVDPNPDIIPSATISVPVARSYTLTNLFGAFTGRATGTTLGSALLLRPTIAQDEVQDRFVTVPTGTTSLRATIGNTTAADLDLFVHRCPTPTTCVQVGSSADGDSEESVTIASPAAGVYRIRVDGFTVASPAEYDYVDVFVNPVFGAVSVTDANAPRPAGRVLLGRVEVRTDANVLVGSGDVIVESVVPA